MFYDRVDYFIWHGILSIGGIMKKLILFLCLSVLVTFGCQDEKLENTQANIVENTVIEINEASQNYYGDFKGFLWEVKHENATVYLFGSVHMADKDIYPFHEDVELAYELSDALVVEADITNTSAIESSAGLILLEAGDKIQNHLTEEGSEKLEKIVNELGVDINIYEKIKVWAAGSTLLSLQLMRGGYMGADGVDMHFLERAHKTEKEVLELESIQFQLELFDSFTDLEQEVMFISNLGTVEETVADFKLLYDHYLDEDETKMTEYLFSDSDDEMTNLEDAILRDRNIGMADKIDGFLQTDKTYFVVVGLAHYLGENSVIKFLEEKGYEIERK